jgi:NAD(P)-dependent dehydrogenase (short-subunit alcohol dehydrogenase family)
MAVGVSARTAGQLDETVALIEQDGGKGLVVVADVTDVQAVDRMVATVEKELGPIDLLVNNAGVAGMSGPIWVVDPDRWWECIDINVRGPFLCSRRVVPGMIERQGGRVVNMSSGASRKPWPNASAYAMSKAAVNLLTENLALEAQAHNVFVFAVNPGVVRTAMTDYSTSAEWRRWDETVANLFAEGHLQAPEETAELIAALATGKADALSGSHIDVSHDLDKLLAHADEIEQRALYRLREQQLPE